MAQVTQKDSTLSIKDLSETDFDDIYEIFVILWRY